MNEFEKAKAVVTQLKAAIKDVPVAELSDILARSESQKTRRDNSIDRKMWEVLNSINDDFMSLRDALAVFVD